MADDELVLTSFVLEEETLVDTWAVEGLKSGTSTVPPRSIGDEVLAVTDRRLMWYDGELQAVDRDDVETFDRTDFSHTSAPRIVSIGWAVFALGAFASAGLFLFTGLGTLAAAIPATTGFATLLTGIVVARMRGEERSEVDLHRLVVDVDEEAVSIWGESEPLEEIQAVMESEEPGSVEDGQADSGGSDAEHLEAGETDDGGREGNGYDAADASEGEEASGNHGDGSEGEEASGNHGDGSADSEPTDAADAAADPSTEDV